MDIRKDKKVKLSKSPEILRKIIENRPISEERLRQVTLLFSKLYFEGIPQLNQREMHLRIFDYEREQRIFLIRTVFSYLFEKEMPHSLIECGSAGDISAALALPQTNVTAVDCDEDVFINEINYLPQQWFDLTKRKRIVAFYNDAKRESFYKKNKIIIDACLPNYKRDIADGKELNYHENSFDCSLVQGTPDMLDMFCQELARVTKTGGYLVNIVMEEKRKKDSDSFYDSERYVCWPEYTHKNFQEDLPFEPIEIPQSLKRLEKLCEWKNNCGELFTSGVVFEIYKKVI